MLREIRDVLQKTLTDERRIKIRRFQAHHLGTLQDLFCRFVLGSNLRALAAFYSTDKWTVHNYIEPYQRHLGPLRRRRLVLLEIGIGGYSDPMDGGGSLRMWRSYLPRSKVYGIDIYDKRAHDGPRIKTFRGSQDDEAFLANVLEQTGRPDIIIDDGSHQSAHVTASFRYLFPWLQPGGLYVIEDTEFSYFEGYGGGEGGNTTMELVKCLTEGLSYEHRSGYEPTEIDKQLASVHIYKNLVIIEKKHAMA